MAFMRRCLSSSFSVFISSTLALVALAAEVCDILSRYALEAEPLAGA